MIQVTLEIYNAQLVERSTPIYQGRKEFMEAFIPIFKSRYQEISGQHEFVNLEYESQLNDADHQDILKSSLAKDRMIQYTSVGIHKDDILFLKDNQPIKKFGSQGQQKTFLVALKLAQFDFLKSQTGRCTNFIT